MSFNQYQFKPFINQAIEELGFVNPTEVQTLVIPRALKGESLIVESATGSGKSHAFLLPLMEKINPELKAVQAIIIVPTRELAQQLYLVSNQIASCYQTKTQVIDVCLAVGGMNRDQEIKRFTNLQPHLVIGTIGRLIDLAITSNVLKIYTSKVVVIDEADMVFDQKELLEVDRLVGIIQEKPQFMLFSATIPQGMRHFINKYLDGVSTIVIEEKELTTTQIEHILIPCKARAKEEVLLSLLNIIHPYLALVFVNTVEKATEVAKFLASHQFQVTILHGSLDDRVRKQTLKRIHDLKYQYVVATDIAARGIDIKGVSHVINFDLPRDVEFYIHRTGRTARHLNTGQAISLYDYDDERYIEMLKAKGLKPKVMRIIDGALKEVSFSQKRSQPSVTKQIEYAAHGMIKIPKKVKPGYKKKRLELINKKIRQDKRQYIENLYRKKKQG